MKLSIPKQVRFIDNAEGDEHVMDLGDWHTLAEIMEHFESFDELKARVSKRKLEEKMSIEYEGLRNIWDESRMPKGTLRETFNGVVNIFADRGTDGRPAAKLAKDLLLALLADEFGTTVRTMKPRLQSLVVAEYVKEEYGVILFPTHMIQR